MDAPGKSVEQDDEDDDDVERVVVEKSGNGGRLVAGAILLAVGAILAVTGVGLLIGVPVALLGFALMFPNFTKIAVPIVLVWLVLQFN